MDMSVSEFLMRGGVWETFNSLKEEYEDAEGFIAFWIPIVVTVRIQLEPISNFQP
jgi:hypothetical protein